MKSRFKTPALKDFVEVYSDWNKRARKELADVFGLDNREHDKDRGHLILVKDGIIYGSSQCGTWPVTEKPLLIDINLLFFVTLNSCLNLNLRVFFLILVCYVVPTTFAFRVSVFPLME